MGILSWFSKKDIHDHDWEILDNEHERDIQKRVAKKLGHDYIRYYHPNITWFQRKVCLSCGKCIDQISDYEKEYGDFLADKVARKKIANKIWSETKNE